LVEKINRMTADGESARAIAEAVGISQTTVYAARKEGLPRSVRLRTNRRVKA
jgi:hypothetical protein